MYTYCVRNWKNTVCCAYRVNFWFKEERLPKWTCVHAAKSVTILWLVHSVQILCSLRRLFPPFACCTESIVGLGTTTQSTSSDFEEPSSIVLPFRTVGGFSTKFYSGSGNKDRDWRHPLCITSASYLLSDRSMHSARPESGPQYGMSVITLVPGTFCRCDMWGKKMCIMGWH